MAMDNSTRQTISQYYDGRAPKYDEGNHSCHIRLGFNYVKWTNPQLGAKVLDLACGTGLVALPIAEAIGGNGLVVGVDIAPKMMDLFRAKLAGLTDEQKGNIAKIEICEHDITSRSLLDIPVVKSVVNAGGFDLISCCSCLPLLPHPAHSITLWTSLLKKGGKLIVDTLTEYPNIHHLFTEALRDEVGIQKDWDRAWIKTKADLERAFTDAGLKVEQCFRSDSVSPVTEYDTNEETGWEIFEQQIKKYTDFEKEGKLDDARRAWPALWTKVTQGEEKYVDGSWLYICIGEKE